jgi:hypothetical protein
VFLRLKRDWDIEYKVFKDDLAKRVLTAHELFDAGGGGFSFKSDSPLGVENLIQFAINLKEDLKPIIGVARTVWKSFWRIFQEWSQFYLSELERHCWPKSDRRNRRESDERESGMIGLLLWRV